MITKKLTPTHVSIKAGPNLIEEAGISCLMYWSDLRLSISLKTINA